MQEIKLSHLDHVAIRVKDIDTTVNWYTSVFGLKKVSTKKWGAFPIFLLAGKTGIAVFPHTENYDASKTKPYKWIDHFAFNVDSENFEIAKTKLNALNIKYDFQDHFYFHSIYINDPDGHMVELTTVVGDGEGFY
jgi:catechol 2,3-dioxygenase-like lactoylglutathione lyase family enzyme